jgi:hypothetical protein
VKRIPVRHRTGIFHPKNVFVLVEDSEPVEDSHRQRALIVASMSTNLTRAGWRKNVQVCHSEEIAQEGSTRLRDDLISLFEGLERRVEEKASDGHASLRAVRSFLGTTEQRAPGKP